MLEQFGLTDAANRQIAQFSGGMRRRLDLAASLITSPPIIFLDEPTAGLDPRTRGQMWETIRGLVADGCTVLLTTQYLDEADQLADRIAAIDHGRLVAEGTPGQLKARVGVSSLHLGVRDPDRVEQAVQIVERLIGDTAVRTAERARLTVPLRDPDRAGDVLIGLREAGVAVESLSVLQPTLDGAFLALTGEDTHEESFRADKGVA